MRIFLLASMALAGVGVIKIAIGLSRDRPILFLSILTIAAVIVLALRVASFSRLTARGLKSGTKLQDVSFELYPGEVLGVVALEGQGQDELFDVLAGADRPTGGELLVDGAALGVVGPHATATRASTLARTATARAPVGRRR